MRSGSGSTPYPVQKSRMTCSCGMTAPRDISRMYSRLTPVLSDALISESVPKIAVTATPKRARLSRASSLDSSFMWAIIADNNSRRKFLQNNAPKGLTTAATVPIMTTAATTTTTAAGDLMNQLPTIRQRRLNLIHGDWYAFVRAERAKGETLARLADRFTYVDRVPVDVTTLQKWIRQAESGRPTTVQQAA